MNRIDKTTHLSPDLIEKLYKSSQNFNWHLIGDAWYGDCTQMIPVINKIAEGINGKAVLRIISSDIYPQLID